MARRAGADLHRPVHAVCEQEIGRALDHKQRAARQSLAVPAVTEEADLIRS